MNNKSFSAQTPFGASSPSAYSSSDDEKSPRAPLDSWTTVSYRSIGSSLEREDVMRSLASVASASDPLARPQLMHGKGGLPLPTADFGFGTAKNFSLSTAPWMQQQQEQALTGLKQLSLQSSPVHPVTECPSIVERTSFLSNTPAGELLAELESTLSHDASVDFSVRASRHQIRGVVTRYCEQVKFHITIFKKGEQFLVEVQRRCGDIFTFSGFYRQLIEAMDTFVCDKVAPRNNQHQQRVPSEPSNVELDEDSCNALLSMALSSTYDVAREGVRCLACMSAQEQNRAVIAKHFDSLSRLLDSQDEEVARCAATLLSNLAQAEQLRPQLTVCLKSLPHLLTQEAVPETRRQVANALFAMAQTHAAQLQRSSTLAATMQKCASAKQIDPRLESPLTSALARMASAH